MAHYYIILFHIIINRSKNNKYMYKHMSHISICFIHALRCYKYDPYNVEICKYSQVCMVRKRYSIYLLMYIL